MSAQTVSRPNDDLAGVGQSVSATTLAGLAIVTASTALMLQSMRVFVSYLVFVIDQSNRSMLAGIAVSVFLVSGLSWVLIKAIGVRRVLIGSTILLGASRLVLQYWQMPEARLWLGAIAIVGWGWLIFAMIVTHRDLVALGIGLGLAFDLGIRVAFRTVDTPWMPGAASHLVTWETVAALLAALWQMDLPSMTHGSTLRPSLSLLAIGPTFALYHLVLGNLGLTQAHLKLDFPGAAVVLTFGTAVGILVAALRSSGEIAILGNRRWWFVWRIGLVLGVSVGLWWFWIEPSLGAIGLILGIASSIVLFTEMMMEAPGTRSTPSSPWPAIFFTIGMLLEVGILFGYYTFSGDPAFIAAAVAVFLAASLACTPRPTLRTRERGFPIVVIAGVIGGLLLLVSGWEVWSWSDAAATGAIGPEMTVMTYNIQTGFSASERFDLEKTAAVIEAQHPDIVVLQEVSRGWLVTSGVDEVLWLSQRLNMTYAFGPNSNDGMWGNVILSKAPLSSEQTLQYTVTENLKRSMLHARVSTQAGDLWIMATHLDDPPDAGPIRLQQANELIATWNHESPALLMGDMNSGPGDPVIAAYDSAGLVDFGRSLGASGFTSKDGRRIDYILGTPDVQLQEIHVPDVWTSDHRPVVARLQILPLQTDTPEWNEIPDGD